MDSAVSVKNLSHSFGELQALRDISFSARKGEVFGLLGANGAGKTTTVKILYGALRPTQGEVRVLGLDPGNAAQAERLHGLIGVMPENTGHYERLSVLANLRFFAEIFRVADPRRRAEELLELVDLSHKAKEAVSSLSKGMRQRLALARALVGNPEFLFLDEPASGLDPNAARKVRDIIREYCRRGGGVLLTTHYLEEAEELCSSIAILDAGRIVCSGNPLDLCQKYLPEQTERVKGGRTILQKPGLEELFYHFTNKNIEE